MKKDERFMTAAKVMKSLEIRRRTLRLLTRRRQMPRPVRIGRATRWICHEFYEWCVLGCPDLSKHDGDFFKWVSDGGEKTHYEDVVKGYRGVERG